MSVNHCPNDCDDAGEYIGPCHRCGTCTTLAAKRAAVQAADDEFLRKLHESRVQHTYTRRVYVEGRYWGVMTACGQFRLRADEYTHDDNVRSCPHCAAGRVVRDVPTMMFGGVREVS
jgi:hypothetical protein